MRWNVGTKIGVGFAVSLAILLIIGAISYRNIIKYTDTTKWVTHTHQVLEELTQLLQGLTDMETGQRGYIVTAEESYLEPYYFGLSAVEESFKGVRELTVDNPNQQQRLNKFETVLRQRLASLKQGIAIHNTEGFQAAKTWVLSGRGKEEMDEIRKLIAEIRGEEELLLKARTTDAEISSQNTKLTILWGTAGALAFVMLISIVLTRNIAGPLREITTTAERIATGDLNVHISTNHRQDEIGVLTQAFARMNHALQEMAEVAQKIADGDLRVKVKPQSERDLLGNAFALMVENLQRLMSEINQGVSILGTAANQISTSTTQLTVSATETATAVTETTTTVEEVRQTAQVANQKAKSVSESAQKAAQSSQVGKKSTEQAITGIQRIREQMGSIADTMVRLSEQTQAIGQIIATVDDFAAQSNLLAVNASIEAAKAGEHGKGFAVVAQEVRSLAEQSKAATNQVRSILSDVQKATSAAVMATEQGGKAVEIGVEQSTQAGDSIQGLRNNVTEAAQASTQIAASSQQQLVGMEQVASAMESIKEATTQNVASAKQLEDSAHNLKELGQNLRQLMEEYRV